MTNRYLQDLLDQARELQTATSQRHRDFLRLCAAAGLAPTLLAAGAKDALGANPKEIVLSAWGGEARSAFRSAYMDPFTKASGIRMGYDSSPEDGKIKAMVENRNVIWDVMDLDGFAAIKLGKQGFLRPIDYSVVGRNALPGLASDFGVPSYLLSYVLVYDARKFGANPPKNWVDFWNVGKFPGKRGLWKWMGGALEAALMADGVDKDKVYPIDVPRALKKLKELRSSVLLWDSGADSLQLLRSGEVSMACIWHTRANVLQRESSGRFRYTWEQGLASCDVWGVLKNNPSGDAVWQFIKFVQGVEPQVRLLSLLGNGPVTPAATAAVPQALRADNPGTPENWAKQCKVNPDWWAQHYEATLAQYTDLISS
ncbi:ABC transporter substrate-binding protein [Burkholderia ambifaria]|uniref:Extracellular solute-binding protein family 1 n=1 Tax=Burkholderia ambifaria MEX-5 TaxID=396597 RepID=B1TBQ6_9BURK|nr:ABC transporter substrate-binding protein [Burkholderia ambifaria]EDT39004.1 extracellular solute-binding protein family 1 [Burkholderia ambifaria MEX-5]